MENIPFLTMWLKNEYKEDTSKNKYNINLQRNRKEYEQLSDSSERSEHLFKVILIGDATVGKTSFVQRYTQNRFSKDYKGTVGVDFALKILKWPDGNVVKLQIWDIAGQERFAWMTRVYYSDACGAIIMFDLSQRDSFLNCAKWKRDVDAKCTLMNGQPIPTILLANKCDLKDREVDQMEIEQLFTEHDFIGWTEISAKEGLMISETMRFLAEVMMKQRAESECYLLEKNEKNNIYLQKHSNNPFQFFCCGRCQQ